MPPASVVIGSETTKIENIDLAIKSSIEKMQLITATGDQGSVSQVCASFSERSDEGARDSGHRGQCQFQKGADG